jgi:GntR family transcriptional regulator
LYTPGVPAARNAPSTRARPARSRPRYAVIDEALREMIVQGRPGDRLPSEAEMCERFGVSRMTARGVVDRLENLGMVYRVKGSGTFIADQPMHRPPGTLLSFSEDMRSRGLTPSSRVLRIGQEQPDEETRRALSLTDDRPVIVLQRLRLANEIAMASERVVLPGMMAAVLAEDLENGSLHEAMERLGHRPVVARGTLRPEAALEEDVELLGVGLGTPLLVEHRVVHDGDDVPIEQTTTRYSPSRYVFDIELRR